MDGLDQTTPLAPIPSTDTAAVSDSAASYLPEPSSTGVGVFHDVLNTAVNLAGEIGGVPLEVTGGLGDLLQTQMQFQMEMAAINLVSNIEKSKHEAKMSVIRNIRVS